jgi:hypothetical protein
MPIAGIQIQILFCKYKVRILQKIGSKMCNTCQTVCIFLCHHYFSAGLFCCKKLLDRYRGTSTQPLHELIFAVAIFLFQTKCYQNSPPAHHQLLPPITFKIFVFGNNSLFITFLKYVSTFSHFEMFGKKQKTAINCKMG